MKSNPQFKFEKQQVNENSIFNTKPEQVVMIELERSMKRLKLRSFKSYLKWVGADRIQRSDIGLKQIAEYLNISERSAEDLAFEWVNNNAIGGRVVYTCGLNCYYFKDVYEITL